MVNLRKPPRETILPFRETKMYLTQKGFSHTGSGIGTEWKPNPIDPNYNLPKYGNTKPQVLSYNLARSSFGL